MSTVPASRGMSVSYAPSARFRASSFFRFFAGRTAASSMGGPAAEGRRLANHLRVSAACDFFTVPTLAFRMLYVFVVLSHDRWRIVHVNVTRNPTAAWTAQQVTEAFPGGHEPRFLHRDRDGTYGSEFRERLRSMAIRDVVSAKQSPWQNPYVERVIGSIRREGTDHVVALGEGRLRSVLREYVEYYNTARCH